MFLTNNNGFKIAGIAVSLAITLQFILGVMTLIFVVPTYLALMHQLGAMILLSSLLYCYYLSSK
jgi:heme A synthase